MIRFRYVPSVPPGAANLAYVQAPIATPESHLVLTEYASEIPENIVDNFGSEITPVVQPAGDPPLTPEYIDTDQIVVSNRSVISKNATKPNKLYYQTTLGLGTFDIYDKEANTSNLAAARDIIRKHIRLLDGQYNPISDIAWDIEVLGAGATSSSFSVQIFLNQVGQGRTFVAQYHAVDSTGDKLPNFREVLNLTPILTVGTDYSVSDVGTNGFEISGLSTDNLAPAIALFGTGQVTVTTDEIDFGGGNITSLQDGGEYRPVQNIVADINAMNVLATARPLSNHNKAKLRPGSFTVGTTGTILKFNNNAHVRYEEKFRIRALKPDATDALSPWYPRVSKGNFTINKGDTVGPYRYKNRDFDYQAFAPTYGPPYKDASQEEPTLLGQDRLRLSRTPLRSSDDISIFVDGVEDSSLIDQVDLQNGIIYLNRTIQPDQDMLISYVYEEQNYVYRNINLNPTLKHNPDIVDKFIGLYIIPNEFLGTSDTFERTIYHIIRDTAKEIIEEVPSIKLSDSSPAQAKLLGIYRIVQTESPQDIDIIDTRSWGGGLRSDLDPNEVQQPETEFYADLGAHFDGKPFPDAGTVIIELPDTIPGTGQVDQVETIYDGKGDLQPIDPSGWVNPTGLLTREEISVKLRRHADPGTFLIEDYY